MAWRRGRAYGPDLRARVLAALDAGATVREAAARFAVGPSYCAKARLRREVTGEVEARPQRGGHRPRLLLPHEAALRARLDAADDATLAGLRAWLRQERGVAASLGTIWTAVARMGLTRKNVWPAPSASGLCEVVRTVCANVSGLGAVAPGQDGEPRALVLIKAPASERHF